MTIAALAVAAGLTGAAGAQTYVARDLGTIGGPTSAAFGLNNFGQAAGASTLPTAWVHGFFWDQNISEILPLPGEMQSHAFAINEAGTVAAVSYGLGELQPQGMTWANGSSTALGNIAPRGINTAGVVVGYLSRYDANFGWMDRPAYAGGTGVVELPTLGGDFGYAAGINSGGWIVGWTFGADDTAPRATLWRSGVVSDLGTLGGTAAQAYAINSANHVVGVSDTAAGDPRAFLFALDSGGHVTQRIDLGVLGGGNSYAYAVNSSDVVVGVSDARACIWRNGTPIDLNTLVPAGHWRLDTAWAINDQGQIAGSGLHDGQPRAFLLTPAPLMAGDLNCDGRVDFNDINPFVLALSNPAAYQAQYPNCNILNGDCNNDGRVDFNDINPFVALLSH